MTPARQIGDVIFSEAFEGAVSIGVECACSTMSFPAEPRCSRGEARNPPGMIARFARGDTSKSARC